MCFTIAFVQYIGCAQVKLTSGGSANPPKIALPGAYKSTDPGITVNIYNNLQSYTAYVFSPSDSCCALSLTRSRMQSRWRCLVRVNGNLSLVPTTYCIIGIWGNQNCILRINSVDMSSTRGTLRRESLGISDGRAADRIRSSLSCPLSNA